MNRMINIRNGNNQPLTMDQIRQVAPSAFATKPYQAMSEKYTYISTAEVIESLMGIGYHAVAASQSRTRTPGKADFTRHMIRFRQDTAAVQVGGTFPEAVLINSHDGASTWKLMGGIFRLVCSNGAIVSESMIASVSIRHMGSVIEDVHSAIGQLIERMPLVTNAIAQWSSIMLTQREQLALAEAANTLRFDEGTPFRPEQLLQVRRHEDTKNDLWTTFNRVQENVMQGGQRAVAVGSNGRPRRVRARAVNSIDGDVKLNRALWQLGERMAELKTAS